MGVTFGPAEVAADHPTPELRSDPPPQGEGNLLPLQAAENASDQRTADLCGDRARDALQRSFHDRLALIAGAAAGGFVAVAAKARQRPAVTRAFILRRGRLARALRQDLVGRFAIDRLVIDAGDGAGMDDRPALDIGHRTDAARWRSDQRALDDRWCALAFEHRNQRLAGAERRDDGGAIESGVGPEGRGRRLHRLLLARRIGAQGMLHAVAELRQHRFRYIERVLGDEIDADALGADQTHHLFDTLDQHLRRIVEEQMRFIEEEDQPRLLRIADLGQFFEQFGQQPQQEGGIEARVHHQLVGCKHRNLPVAVIADPHDVGNLQSRLAEEVFGTLLLQDKHRTLDRADGGFRDQAVFAGKLAGIVAHIVQQRLQILEVEQRQTVFVGDLEGDVEHAFLRLRGVHQPCQQQRPHLGDGGAHAMALFAVKIPEDDRKLIEFIGRQADFLGALEQEILGLALDGDAGEIALDVGAEDRHASLGKSFRQHLQGHRLAGACGASDEAVAVAEFQRQELVLVDAFIRIAARADENLSILLRHGVVSLWAAAQQLLQAARAIHRFVLTLL
ncbi:hypothetical protein RHSP_33286 [Rhizobium freirei PRF 81]|uniref:Uncharacterized protein n=1 Tax=Rhizobium freirei PRF 81 TaxID=363754 RepID=N6UWW8_9HYPH|nr:hypothetical protein RHSP_33286 [Rhizobium freirei PRF 81]